VFVPSFGETDIFPDYFKYRGATITVSGRIQRRNGYLGIDVSDPSQIVAKTEGLEDHAYLGHMKHKKGDLDGAIAELDRAIEQDKQDSSNFKERASIKAEKGDAEGAIADYNRCLELTPNDTDAMWALGRLKLMMGDFDGAVALYDRSIKVFPRWCEAYNQRGLAKQTAGDVAGAIEDFETALKIEPSNASYRSNVQKAKALQTGNRGTTQIKSVSSQMQLPAQHSSPAAASSTSAPASKPVSAEIIDIPPGQAEAGIKAGNIRVTFSDGHVANQTYAGNCMKPHVSGSGLVGWVKCNGFDRKGYPLDEKLVVGPPNGFMKQFAPEPRFVEEWAFADNDSTIVMRCHGFHGASYYLRYDLATGRITNRGGGNDANPAPPWARPVAQE